MAGARTARFEGATNSKPLMMGEWADICVLKDKDNYYLAHSSGDYYPGALIWHSKDLKVWKPVVHSVIDHPYSVWLTDLYKYKGRYYILFLSNFNMTGGYMISADRIEGPWSEPVRTGLMPDSVFVEDDDGKRYLFNYGGHMTVDDNEFKAAKSPQRLLKGWPEPITWARECRSVTPAGAGEAPKVLKKNGYWYWLTAQGGTFGPSTSHNVIASRALSPYGPWELSPYNPIIQTRDRDEEWWTKGHGQLVEGPDGYWYCILHGYKNGLRSLGRCTLIGADKGVRNHSKQWFLTPLSSSNG